MTETPDKQFLLDEFNKCAAYMDEVLAGKKTIAEAVNVPPEELDTYFETAQQALKLEDFERAEELFTTLMILNGKDTRATLGLAAALEGQGKYELAVPIYLMVMATTLYDPVAPFRAGICLMNVGKKPEAINALQLAADCGDDVKDPRKLVYVHQARTLLEALSARK